MSKRNEEEWYVPARKMPKLNSAGRSLEVIISVERESPYNKNKKTRYVTAGHYDKKHKQWVLTEEAYKEMEHTMVDVLAWRPFPEPYEG